MADAVGDPGAETPWSAHHELSRLIARHGWTGAPIPPEHGGMGAGHLARTIVVEELSRVSGALGATAQAAQLGAAKIAHFGSTAQQRTWAASIASGECLPTIPVSGPVPGRAALGVTASAARAGDDYLLNGRQVYVCNGHGGDLHIVVLRTGAGPDDLTAFLVEADRPGLALVPEQGAPGRNGCAVGELAFDNCRVPVSHRLGAEGDGLRVASSSGAPEGRATLTAVSLGIHQALMDETVRFTSTRKRYGRPLHHLPEVRRVLGQMQSRLTAARLAAYRAAHLLDQGGSGDSEGELMNAELVNIEATLVTARGAMAVRSAAGWHAAGSVERCLRDAHRIVAPAGPAADAGATRTGRTGSELEPAP